MKKLLLLIACVCLAVIPGVAQAQESAPAKAPVIQQKNLFQSLVEGGWVMFPIALCSVLTVYFVGDGFNRTNRKRVAPQNHIDEVKQLFRAGDYLGAYQYCKSNPTPVTNVLRVGVSLAGEGKEECEIAMQEEIAKENSEIQTRISYLSVIGVCAPMIGLLGTVTGMIRAFATLGQEGIGDPGKLSGAIGEVLIATASGLFVAIPAFVGFYFLRNRSAVAVHYIQEVINTLFRKMPWPSLAGVHLSEDELFAAEPNWLGSHAAETGEAAAPDAGHPELQQNSL